MKIISACGNNCSICPRHMPKTGEELHKTSKLWHKIGYRDKVVSNEEIQCAGCSAGNWCRYKIVDCVAEKQIENCGQCAGYPCGKIKEAFAKTAQFEPNCKAYCTGEEYAVMRRAFFEKSKNLDEIASLIK